MCRALLAAAMLLCACQRKAPGPDECERYAERAIGVARERALRSPRARTEFDEITRLCLTAPFDRELIACVDTTGQVRACTAEFEQRRQRR